MLIAEPSEIENDNSMLSELDSVLFEKQILKPTRRKMVTEWTQLQQDHDRELDSFLKLEKQVADENAADAQNVDIEEPKESKIEKGFELDSGVLDIGELESFFVNSLVLPMADESKENVEASFLAKYKEEPIEAQDISFTLKATRVLEPKVLDSHQPKTHSPNADADKPIQSKLLLKLFPALHDEPKKPEPIVDKCSNCDVLSTKETQLKEQLLLFQTKLTEAENQIKALNMRLKSAQSSKNSADLALEAQKQEFEDYKLVQERLLKRERLLWEKSKKASEILPTKKDRQELESLQMELEDARAEIGRKESRWTLERDRLRQKSDQVAAKNKELLEEIRIMEADRAAWLEKKTAENVRRPTVSVGVQFSEPEGTTQRRVLFNSVSHPALDAMNRSETCHLYFSNGDFYIVPSDAADEVKQQLETTSARALLRQFGGVYYFSASNVFQTYLPQSMAYLLEFSLQKQVEYHFDNGEKYLEFADGVKMSIYPPPSLPTPQELDDLVCGRLPPKTWTEQLIEFPDGAVQVVKCTLVDPVECLVKREKIISPSSV